MTRRIVPGQFRVIAGTIAVLALAGCAHAPPPKIEYREVKVPIPVPCKTTEPAKPAYAADDVGLDAPLFDLVRALLVEREQRKAETVELRAANKACS